jgi:DNA-binding NarL/FixJ family response regulator
MTVATALERRRPAPKKSAEYSSPPSGLVARPGTPEFSPSFDLSTLWHDLICGRCRIVTTSVTEESCHATIELAEPSHYGDVTSPRKIAILERVLLGSAQKSVAADFNVSSPTIAMGCAECLHTMGIATTASRVPLIVALAVHAFHRTAGFRDSCTRVLLDETRSCRIVSTPRPDTMLLEAFTPAQGVVARLFVEGKSHSEIAARRGISMRTVANQLAAVFHRLAVSGRLQLIEHLVHTKRVRSDA